MSEFNRPSRKLINFIYKVKKIVEEVLFFIYKKIINVKKYSMSHSIIIPSATYSPWNDNREFMNVVKEIKSKTVLDIMRLYELWYLDDQLKHVEGEYIEIGTYKGGSAALIAKKNSNSTFFVCDTFQGVASASEHDNKYLGGEHSDVTKKDIVNFFNSLQIKNYKIIEGIFPESASNFLDNTKIKYCHIDVDTYLSAKNSYDFLWNKISKGGMIIFDDYGFIGTEGVTKFVNEIKDDSENIFFHNLNGHAIIVKI
jgi:O-methyltransferase